MIFTTKFLTLRLLYAFIIFTSMDSDAELIEKFEHVSTACNAFATNFYRVLSSSRNDNVVSSPFSLHSILSLLFHGAENPTKSEFRKVLFLENPDLIREDTKRLIPQFNSNEGVDVSVSNAIYSRQNVEIFDEFLSTAREHFYSDVSSIDFSQKSDAVDRINSWVKKKTKNKISSVITENDIDDYTAAVLINAVYFKCNWLYKFDPENTKPREFHLSKSQSKQVAAMFKKRNFVRGEIEDLQSTFIKIPYENEDFEMVIVLPSEVDGLKVLEEKFNFSILSKLSGIDSRTLLILPKFRFEVTMDLGEILRKLNLGGMFEKTANFSKMSKEELKVDKVFQKVLIEVNEEGSEAAAATAVTMRTKRSMMDYEEFIVDHPFMFLIMHKPSNIPLFAGSVRDLEQIAQEKDEL